MLETLRRMVLGDPSPKAPATNDLQHIEQVLASTQADLAEAQEAVEHFRQQLAACDARALLDEPDTGDGLDAADWRQRLIEAQDDVTRLTAALPRLEAQQAEAQAALKKHQLTTCLDRIEGHKRHYADLPSVLTSQLGSAADTAAQMAALTEAIEAGRTQATALQVEMGRPPRGISFQSVDVRTLWVQSLSKARRPAVTPPESPPTVPTVVVVTEGVAPVTSPEARTWYEADGHRWELIALPSPATCHHRMGNKSAEGTGCSEPATMLARYIIPGGELREWAYCVAHAERYAAAHHLTPEGSRWEC